jgi:hypothetical protein
MVLKLGNLASYFICVARIKIDLENDMRVWGFSRVVFFLFYDMKCIKSGNYLQTQMWSYFKHLFIRTMFCHNQKRLVRRDLKFTAVSGVNMGLIKLLST